MLFLVVKTFIQSSSFVFYDQDMNVPVKNITEVSNIVTGWSLLNEWLDGVRN